MTEQPVVIRAFQQFSLSQAAQYDFKCGARNKVTSWGLICRDRQDRGTSRAARRKARGEMPFKRGKK